MTDYPTLIEKLERSHGGVPCVATAEIRRLIADNEALRKALEYIEGATAGLLAKMDAIESLRTALAQQGEPSNLLGEIIGCFDAAIAEGLYEAIAETNDGRLKDLLERRVMHAYVKAIGPDTSAPAPQQDGTLINEGTKSAPAPRPAQEQVGINGLTEAETSATMSVRGLSKPAPPWYGELIRLAAWLLSPYATHNFDSLEENTHIGHRQFAKAQEATREVLRNKAWEIRKIADALAAVQSAQPVSANIQTKIVKDISAHEGGNCCLPPLPTTELAARASGL